MAHISGRANSGKTVTTLNRFILYMKSLVFKQAKKSQLDVTFTWGSCGITN